MQDEVVDEVDMAVAAAGELDGDGEDRAAAVAASGVGKETAAWRGAGA